MAELIPIEYRMRVVQREQIARWISTGVIVLLLAGAGLAYTFFWDRQQTTLYETRYNAYHERSALITESQSFLARRQDLAGRMAKIQELMDDKVLLSLLRNISGGFSGNNCLQFVSITAHDVAKGNDPAAAVDPNEYTVRINGITENSMTLAELMTRLGKQSTPAMNVVLESSRREAILDGQVMRFEILCEKPDNKGT